LIAVHIRIFILHPVPATHGEENNRAAEDHG